MSRDVAQIVQTRTLTSDYMSFVSKFVPDEKLCELIVVLGVQKRARGIINSR